MRVRLTHFILTGVLSVVWSAHSVIFYSSGDPAYNTTAPTGSLADSGWQFQGRFRQFLGTPVSAHHFITAKHIGGSVGNTFIFEGMTYTIVSKIPDPSSDLVLYKVDGTFPRYAPLYESSDEVNRDCVVFGRGTQRGSEVYANGELKGWKWGAVDSVLRWGENRIDAVTTLNGYPVLQADFDSAGGVGANECMLSNGDSAGAIFINDGGVWKLAGINWAVSPATFSFSSTGSSPFNAALFDYSFRPSNAEKIYYDDGSPPWPYLNDSGNDPVRFFSTRISSRYTWIKNNIPEFDQDVDGLPDWWEMEYTGSPTAMIAAEDNDDDGFTNYEEWIADTIPIDGNSFLRIAATNNAMDVVFNSSTSRQYQVQYRSSLADTNETWLTEVDWFDPVSTQSVVSVSTSADEGYYRVGARL